MYIFDKNNVLPDKLFVFAHQAEAGPALYDDGLKLWLEKRSPFLSTLKMSGISFLDFLLLQAFQYNVNPKLMICTCQRERSLVTTKEPTAHDLSRSFGVGCTDAGDIAGLLNLGRQIQGCAEIYERWFKDFYPGRILAVDDVTDTVNPANAATYSLYKYCPHIGTKESPQFAKYGYYGVYELIRIWGVFWPEDLQESS